ncbi:MAG: CehA/McbA family metallohydrolase [Planctomycetaceae bacterium]|nr:CehA/McbA family metallohydrolase [Planctomycetales bacterium]MCB9926780.1 CehA/McbA family metallohydrolase [Planctomycetaceae bacterium]
MSVARLMSVLLLVYALGQQVRAEPNPITIRMHHLRVGAEREWSDFPETPESTRLSLSFAAKSSDKVSTLRLRQQDVKQTWKVRLNNEDLGGLLIDENDMVIYFQVPPGILVDGVNQLRIEQQGNQSDDIRVGDIWIDDRSVTQVLGEATVDLSVVDADRQQPIPCRITILNADGALQTPGCQSNDHLAVRPGIVYTSTGHASFGLPEGSYRVIVGRGFEYSIDESELAVKAGDKISRTLSIRREVPTEGYVACDTHVHTRTHSGHGDATVQERMITLAAEGIELPVATDHNAHIDHDPFAREMKVRRYFTPVVGNEVTTRTGHFNIFPVAQGAKTPDHRSDEWKQTLGNIFDVPGVQVAILNHARDVHGGTTPFAPQQFNDAVGENTAGWYMGFNAMEVVNSGATQTDVLQLFHDWMALLNRGYSITPVGSSDSHDVGRHFVGQGRTYIRCDDRDASNIDVARATESFMHGNVMVSYGLLAELKVNGRYQSGDLAKVAGDEVTVDLRILGPRWVSVDKVMLFANGELVREQAVEDGDHRAQLAGVLWADQWKLSTAHYDRHLVAIAVGPGIQSLHWRTAKPYQPDTIDPKTSVLGCSGAVWLDADGDGERSSARHYAEEIVSRARGDLQVLFNDLSHYDSAVAAQTALLLQASGHSLIDEAIQQHLANASESTSRGFKRYFDAWREGQLARQAR